MGMLDFLRNRGSIESVSTESAVVDSKGADIFKAYIPNFLYKPPFGMPRRDNTPQMKKLSENPYVFSIIKTLCDEATSIDWEIKVKEEFQKAFDVQANPVEEEDESPGVKVDYDEKIKEITKFFRNPNGNEESFNHILRQVITDICEVDSGVIVKVFDVEGNFKQMFARDGSLFLKNPDIYGYIGNRRDFVLPLPDGFSGVGIDLGGTPTASQQQLMKTYSLLYKEDAAYFQYGWTAGSMPVPFGKREIVYIMQNPRGDSIYGRSAVGILMNTILNLIYGQEFNLDYYTNNNMPDGVIQLLGATKEQIIQYRENMESQFRETDTFGKKVKRFFKVPIVNTEAKFTAFTMSAKEMEVIAQQEWFTKILWMSFGVNADEMGFTENSNKATGEAQIKTFKRKAIRPLLDIIEYHLNTQIVSEFFSKPGEGNLKDFSEVPVYFEFDTYDVDEDVKELNKFKLELDMGIKTNMMIAKERGINLDELSEELERKKEEEFEEQERLNEGFDNGVEEKARSHKYIRKIGTGKHARYLYKLPVGSKKKDEILSTEQVKKAQVQSVLDNKAVIDLANSKIPLAKKKIVARNWRSLLAGNDTLNIHTDEKGKFTEERRKTVHKPIYRKYNTAIKKAKADGKPHVIFMAGVPGAGKTFATKEIFNYSDDGKTAVNKKSGKTYVIINADDIKADLPEYKGGDGSSLVHEESSTLSKKFMQLAIRSNANVIFDGTLSNAESSLKKVNTFNDMGYDSDAIFVDTDVPTAIYNAATRFKKKGRYVNYDMIAEASPSVKNTIKKMSKNFNNIKVIKTTREDIDWDKI